MKTHAKLLLAAALGFCLSAGTQAHRPDRSLRTGGQLPTLDSLQRRGVVVLQSPNYGVELSSGLTEYLLGEGVPVYLDPVRVLAAATLPITGGDDDQQLQTELASDYGFRPPAEAYGLIIDVATGLPAFFGVRNQTRVYLVERGSGRIVRFVSANGLRDEEDAREVFRALLSPD